MQRRVSSLDVVRCSPLDRRRGSAKRGMSEASDCTAFYKYCLLSVVFSCSSWFSANSVIEPAVLFFLLGLLIVSAVRGSVGDVEKKSESERDE